MELRTPAERVHSLDALRGFDMLWIVGGRETLLALSVVLGSTGLHDSAAHQLEHSAWHGVTAWDLVFPLFLFLAGCSMPFSFERRRQRGQTRAMLLRHATVRGAILVALGVLYNGLLGLDAEHLRFASVLGRIGLAWMMAAWIAIFWGVRGQAVATAVLLLAVSAAMLWLPVPEFGAGQLVQGRNLGDWLDQRLLPGRLHGGDHDPEGLFSTLPAVATALLGSLCGIWLRFRGGRASTSSGMLVGGLALLALGWLSHSLGLPINKRLWTPSFVLWAAGCSAILLASFHWLIDVVGLRRAAFPLIVIGSNAIAAYLLHRFVDFEALSALLLGRALEKGVVHEAFVPLGGLGLLWGLLAWMRRRGWFLRV